MSLKLQDFIDNFSEKGAGVLITADMGVTTGNKKKAVFDGSATVLREDSSWRNIFTSDVHLLKNGGYPLYVYVAVVSVLVGFICIYATYSSFSQPSTGGVSRTVLRVSVFVVIAALVAIMPILHAIRREQTRDAFGFVWDPKDNLDVAVCAYPQDGGTNVRHRNGRFDRCGSLIGVNIRWATLVIVAAVSSVFFTIFWYKGLPQKACVLLSLMVAGVLTISIIWSHDRMQSTSFFDKPTRCTAVNDCIGEVLMRAKTMKGCPSPIGLRRYVPLVTVGVLVAVFSGTVAHRNDFGSILQVASLSFVATTGAFVLIGAISGSSVWNPVPMGCKTENEIVVMSSVDKGVAASDFSQLRKHGLLTPPAALLYITANRAGNATTFDLQGLQDRIDIWGGDKKILTISYPPSGGRPVFTRFETLNDMKQRMS